MVITDWFYGIQPQICQLLYIKETVCFKKTSSILKIEKISPSSTYLMIYMFLANFRSETQSSLCCVLDFFLLLLPRYF